MPFEYRLGGQMSQSLCFGEDINLLPLPGYHGSSDIQLSHAKTDLMEVGCEEGKIMKLP